MATVLAVAAVAAGDERRHRPGRERLWCEAWSFDFAATDLSVGGFVRLGLYPHLGVAWYWAALVGRSRRLVLVRDHEIELPRGAPLEVRGQGLWSAVNCETPLDHWSIGLEAFAVAMDDPLEAYREERGDVVGLGFDLEWEARATALPFEDGHYEQSCQVHGEVLVGEERLDFEGAGQRAHSWGLADWWSESRTWVAGLLSDGTSFGATAGGARPGRGAVAGTGTDPGRGAAAGAGTDPGRGAAAGAGESVAVGDVEISADLDAAGLPMTVSISIGDLVLVASPVAHAPMMLEAPDGRRSRLARSLCRYRAEDGREGGGWLEVLQPPGR